MSVIKRTRGAQWPLLQEYVFNYNDGVAALSSLGAASVDDTPKATITDFGSHTQPAGMISGAPYVANGGSAAPTYFEMFSLPNGAQIIGGDMQIEAPYVGPNTVTLAIGDRNGPLYLAAQTLKASAFAANISAITNAESDVTRQKIVVTNTGIAIGQTVTISGIVPAAYNGTFIVVAVNSTTDITVINPALTAALTYVSGTAGTFLAGRTALSIPTESSAGAPSGALEAASGANVIGTLTFGNTAAATQGRVRVRVLYTIDGRVNEASPN